MESTRKWPINSVIISPFCLFIVCQSLVVFLVAVVHSTLSNAKGRKERFFKEEATSKPAAADATKTTEKSGPEAKLKGTW